ncbi:hypothetical protein [Mycolicibacterium sphagni]|uniref:hypothetical protein n=1 Tax=Mycolicibacterium sphagni TaxID=1786 RepID=UPI0021F38F2D|nr:hypothetical protein [Mycolicibacterium sphagni]MCV7174917.1 hypothetical protein [Mycolicibacterium sphagni]
MPTDHQAVPMQVVEMVESYIHKEISDSGRYEDRAPLDEDGTFLLHRLAANIYAAGWADAERTVMRRESAARLRRRDAEQRADGTKPPQ